MRNLPEDSEKVEAKIQLLMSCTVSRRVADICLSSHTQSMCNRHLFIRTHSPSVTDICLSGHTSPSVTSVYPDTESKCDICLSGHTSPSVTDMFNRKHTVHV
jgi:hypothetical protein